MMNKRILDLILGLSLALIVFNDYKKTLDKAISFKPNNFITLIERDINGIYEFG